MSEYVLDTDIGHGYFRENEESEQHSALLIISFEFPSFPSYSLAYILNLGFKYFGFRHKIGLDYI